MMEPGSKVGLYYSLWILVNFYFPSRIDFLAFFKLKMHVLFLK